MVTDNDPEEMRKKYEMEYHKYSEESRTASVKEPKFSFYLYDDAGDLVQ